MDALEYDSLIDETIEYLMRCNEGETPESIQRQREEEQERIIREREGSFRERLDRIDRTLHSREDQAEGILNGLTALFQSPTEEENDDAQDSLNGRVNIFVASELQMNNLLQQIADLERINADLMQAIQEGEKSLHKMKNQKVVLMHHISQLENTLDKAENKYDFQTFLNECGQRTSNYFVNNHQRE
jgi:hypothetical protein